MSKVKHTPGPWKVDNGNRYIYVRKNQAAVCEIFGKRSHGDSSYADDDTADANARLIAAAPELLAQLKYCNEVLRNWLPEKSAALVEENLKVIAKAEGSKE